jgi:hypothetical protein
MATETMSAAKQQSLNAYEKEHATTLKVLKAYPADKLELRPHKMCKDARGLAWMFVIEQGFMEKGATPGFDWSAAPAPFPKPPESWDTLLSTFDNGGLMALMAATIFSVSGANWLSTISTPSGPARTPIMPPCPSSV